MLFGNTVSDVKVTVQSIVLGGVCRYVDKISSS